MNDTDIILNLNCRLGMKVSIGGPDFLLCCRNAQYIGYNTYPLLNTWFKLHTRQVCSFKNINTLVRFFKSNQAKKKKVIKQPC